MYVHTHTNTKTHTHTLEYYSSINKKILPFMTVLLDLEGIMLSEKSQTEKDNNAQFHLYVESKKQNRSAYCGVMGLAVSLQH